MIKSTRIVLIEKYNEKIKEENKILEVVEAMIKDFSEANEISEALGGNKIEPDLWMSFGCSKNLITKSILTYLNSHSRIKYEFTTRDGRDVCLISIKG